MNLIWRAGAQADLNHIISYIAERNPAAAQRLKQTIEDRVERLTQHPFMYRAGRVADTREAVVHPNYIVVYRVGADAIEVTAVMHSRRAYPGEDIE